MQVLAAAGWEARAAEEMKPTNRALFRLDGRQVTYGELKAERGEPYVHLCTRANFEAWAQEARDSVRHLSQELQKAAPDIVVVIGDDQRELYAPENTPAVAIYHGAQVVMHPVNLASRPAWSGPVWRGYGMDAARTFPAVPELARELIVSMVDLGVDLAACAEVPEPGVRGFGHAFGFVAMHLFGERPIPMLPVLLNTYSPPNVPTSSRAYEIGQKLRTALESSDSPARVALIASGGLSHFICEEEHDRKLMRAIQAGDAATLRSVPRGALMSGSSEILNWILAAGALQGLGVTWSNYIPIRRTPAGTGIGLGFMVWR
jgi:hypothetical protein